MKEKDIKILWGRSGNRCAICKLELTPEGEASTIGEMAHIIAYSNNGARGDSELPASERDNYSNLILVCPTHHVQIDKNPDEWAVEKLRQIKASHEGWVSQQLDQGNISVRAIDNSKFISTRIESWNEFAKGKVWVVVSITPLNIGGDLINPIDSQFINEINRIELPHKISRNPIVNSYNTRPNENGLVNDELEDLSKGDAHRIQVFRNGHCEFMICLQGSVDQMTSQANKYDPESRGLRVVRYPHLAECILFQINALFKLWIKCLPFKDMLLSSHILNTKNTMLYSRHISSNGPLYGYPVESNLLEIKDIVNKNTSAIEAGDLLVKTFVNYFGLVLNHVRDQKGDLVMPSKLTKSI
jgi:hypothetical protein